MNLAALHLLAGVLLLAAVVAAMLLVRETGRRRAWFVLAGAMALMSLRSFALATPFILGRELAWGEVVPPLLTLLVALLMLTGIAMVAAMFRDLESAQVRVERLLTESRANTERFQTIFENIPDGAFLHDPAGVLLDGNRQALELIGYEAEEVVGRNLLDIGVLVDEDYARVNRALQQAPKHDAREYLIRRRDGTEVPVEVRSFPVTLDGERQILVSARDLTERKSVEERILSLGRLVDESVNEVYVIDFKTLRFLRVNDGACRNLGYTAEELKSLVTPVVVPDLDVPEFLEILRPILAEGASMGQVRTTHRRKDGSTYPVHSQVQRSRLFGREVIVVFSIDLTEQENIYAELRRSEERLSEAQRVGHLGSWVWSIAEGGLNWSDEVFNVTGVGREDFDGTLDGWFSYIHPDDREGVLAKANLMIESGERLSVDHRLLLPSGEIRYMQETGEVSTWKDGKAVTALGTIVDITRRKQAEEALQTLNRELEDRVAARTVDLEAAITELESFSYSVSHDLRQPLRSVDGYIRIIEEEASGSFDESTRTYFDRILATVERMSEMIDGLLLLSRIGRTELVLESVDLSSMVTGMLDDLVESAPSRTLQSNVAPGITGIGDSRLIDLLLRNLLGNAFKFTGTTERGKITFDVAFDEGGPVYALRDNGVGFSMDFENKLFGAFQRLHRADEFPGTGVGLATAERIVRRHGGRIWAEAKPGQGATFFFTLGSPDRQGAAGGF